VTACHVSTYYYVGFCYMMLRRYTDATRTFVSILNLILRMRQYHTRSYQYDQINKTADRMYALFAVCNALSPNRLDDNILNIVKERFGEQVTKMSRGEEGIPAFEELFTYACPKFVSANPPPYDDTEALAAYLEDSHTDPAQRHLKDFTADVRAQLPVPTLRSFLKLYTSLGTSKLAGFLDTDEEAMVQQLMVLKQASRSIGRVGNEKSLLEGSTVSNNDLDFVIDEVMPKLAFRRCPTKIADNCFDFVFYRTWSTSPSRLWAVGTPGGSSETQSTPSVCTTVSRIPRSQFRSNRPTLRHNSNSNSNSPANPNSSLKAKPLLGVESKLLPRSDPRVAGSPSIASLFLVVFCNPFAGTNFVLYAANKTWWSAIHFDPCIHFSYRTGQTGFQYEQKTSRGNQKGKNLHTVRKPKTQR